MASKSIKSRSRLESDVQPRPRLDSDVLAKVLQNARANARSLPAEVNFSLRNYYATQKSIVTTGPLHSEIAPVVCDGNLIPCQACMK